MISKSNFENNSSKTVWFSNSFVLNDSREAEFVYGTLRSENPSPDSRLHISIKPKTSQIDGGTSLKLSSNLNMHMFMQINEDWNRNYLELPKTTSSPFSPAQSLLYGRNEKKRKGKLYIYPSSRAKSYFF